MDDTLTSIIGLAVAVILMFIFPLVTMSDRTDDVSQLTVDIATTEFVDDIRESGKITPDRYSKYIESIGSTGNTYNIELEVKILDENPKRKVIELPQTMETTDNVYYSVYNSQIENVLNNGNDYYLKEGDIVKVSAKNTNQTIAQQLKNFFYTVVGRDTYVIGSSHGGLVTATGG